MFTIEQIEEAHDNVKTGAAFPEFIAAIKAMGVIAFETSVVDRRTEYIGENNYKVNSLPLGEMLIVANSSNAEDFMICLKRHQLGETDFITFCKDCAKNGIERWNVSLENMTCTYFDTSNNIMLSEKIPG